MNNYEYLKSLSINELSDWLDKHGNFDNSPWTNWFDKTYCKKCDSIEVTFESGNKGICAYCELYGKCKYFPDYNKELDNKDIIKLWLEKTKE